MQNRGQRLNTIVLGAWSYLPAAEGNREGNVPNFLSIRVLQRVLRDDLQAIQQGQPFAQLTLRRVGHVGNQRSWTWSLLTLPIAPFLINRDRRQIRQIRMTTP
jgi:hypothetical protein